MIKEDIRKIFKKDKKLAVEVAKVLGYKLNIAAKDDVSKKLSALVNKVLNVKPKSFKVKVKGDKSLYQWGDLNKDSVVLKVNRNGDTWSYAFGIPNIKGSAGGAFLKAGKGTFDEMIKSFEDSLKKAKTFLKNREASINEDATIEK